jgi:hypothetical protein
VDGSKTPLSETCEGVVVTVVAVEEEACVLLVVDCVVVGEVCDCGFGGGNGSGFADFALAVVFAVVETCVDCGVE